MLSLSLLIVLMFFSPISIMITWLGEERAGLYASRAFIMFILHTLLFVFFSSSWCVGLAVNYDCGTPWTFYLIYCIIQDDRKQ